MLFMQYGTDPDQMVSALQREGMIALRAAQFYQEAKELQEQLAGEKDPPPPDPLVELKEKELGIRAQEAQARAQADQVKLALSEQKEQNRATEAQARLQLQQAELSEAKQRDLDRIRQQQMERAEKTRLEMIRIMQKGGPNVQ